MARALDFFGGFKLTFQHLTRPTVTTSYPKAKRPKQPRQHVASVLTGLLGALGLRVASRHRRSGEVLEGQLESAEEVESPGHQSLSSSVIERKTSPGNGRPPTMGNTESAPTSRL